MSVVESEEKNVQPKKKKKKWSAKIVNHTFFYIILVFTHTYSLTLMLGIYGDGNHRYFVVWLVVMYETMYRCV